MTLQKQAQPPAALTIALTGAIALAAAMGLGRFAFTPMLPLMLAESQLNIQQGSWLATLNYVGYLLGALACMLLPALLRVRNARTTPAGKHSSPVPVLSQEALAAKQLRALSAPLFLLGLVLTAVLLAVMALPMYWLWAWARLLAGVASAIVFVHTAGWCLEQLSLRGADALGGFIFIGPGMGIVLSGLLAAQMHAWGALSAWVWLLMAVTALCMCAWTAAVVRRNALTQSVEATTTAPGTPPPEPQAPASGRAQPVWTQEQLLLMLAYGLSGFGYIITATYLPVIALATIPDSPWIASFWLIFGLCIAVGAASTRMVPSQIDRRWLLIACYLLQALGVILPLLLPTSAGFVLGSILLGLPFTAITLFGMQEARRLRPQQATAFMGGLTSLYGLGQIAGPPLVVLVLAHASALQDGFAVSLWIAAASLLLGTALFAAMLWRYPQR